MPTVWHICARPSDLILRDTSGRLSGSRRFPIVRTDSPDHSGCDENFTLINSIQPDQSNPKQYAQRKWFFSKNSLKKRIDWSGQPVLTNGKCRNQQLHHFLRNVDCVPRPSVTQWNFLYRNLSVPVNPLGDVSLKMSTVHSCIMINIGESAFFLVSHCKEKCGAKYLLTSCKTTNLSLNAGYLKTNTQNMTVFFSR